MQTNRQTEGVLPPTESRRIETEIPSAGPVTGSAKASVDPRGRTLDQAAQDDLRARKAELARLERHAELLRWADLLFAIVGGPVLFCAFGLVIPPFSDSRFVAPGCVVILVWFLIWRKKRRVEAQLPLFGGDPSGGWERADPG